MEISSSQKQSVSVAFPICRVPLKEYINAILSAWDGAKISTNHFSPQFFGRKVWERGGKRGKMLSVVAGRTVCALARKSEFQKLC